MASTSGVRRSARLQAKAEAESRDAESSSSEAPAPITLPEEPHFRSSIYIRQRAPTPGPNFSFSLDNFLVAQQQQQQQLPPAPPVRRSPRIIAIRERQAQEERERLLAESPRTSTPFTIAHVSPFNYNPVNRASVSNVFNNHEFVINRPYISHGAIENLLFSMDNAGHVDIDDPLAHDSIDPDDVSEYETSSDVSDEEPPPVDPVDTTEDFNAHVQAFDNTMHRRRAANNTLRFRQPYASRNPVVRGIRSIISTFSSIGHGGRKATRRGIRKVTKATISKLYYRRGQLKVDNVPACTICFADPPKKPVACGTCKQVVGCRHCVKKWYRTTNISDLDSRPIIPMSNLNHKCCPLCRATWRQLKLLRVVSKPVKQVS